MRTKCRPQRQLQLHKSIDLARMSSISSSLSLIHSFEHLYICSPMFVYQLLLFGRGLGRSTAFSPAQLTDFELLLLRSLFVWFSLSLAPLQFSDRAASCQLPVASCCWQLLVASCRLLLQLLASLNRRPFSPEFSGSRVRAQVLPGSFPWSLGWFILLCQVFRVAKDFQLSCPLCFANINNLQLVCICCCCCRLKVALVNPKKARRLRSQSPLGWGKAWKSCIWLLRRGKQILLAGCLWN